MGTANRCRNHGMTVDQAVTHITSALTRAPDPKNEVLSAVTKAFTDGGQVSAGRVNIIPQPGAPRQPWRLTDQERVTRMKDKADPVLIATLAARLGGLHDLWESSAPMLDSNARHTEETIDLMFPGNPLLCAGWAKNKFDTRPREEWRGHLTGTSFIVPSPAIQPRGARLSDGAPSAHCKEQFPARRFLVIEFDDQRPKDEQAARLLHLAAFAPMVLVVDSAGKSLHGWFFVQDAPPGAILKFFLHALTLGADPRTWGASQFIRTPDGTRDGGLRQTILHQNLPLPLPPCHTQPLTPTLAP